MACRRGWTAAKASLHTLNSLGVTTPSGLLAGMNNAILATARQTLLMTCLIASIDLSAGTIRIANAGLNFPFLQRKGAKEPEMLETTAGYPLGFDKDADFPESRTDCAPGDALFMYTDGLIECLERQRRGTRLPAPPRDAEGGEAFPIPIAARFPARLGGRLHGDRRFRRRCDDPFRQV